MLIDKNFAKSIEHIIPSPYVSSARFRNAIKGRLELTLVRLRTNRLPREYSSILVACDYIPEFNNPQAQTNAVYKLIYALGETIFTKSGNCKSLLYVCGTSTVQI